MTNEKVPANLLFRNSLFATKKPNAWIVIDKPGLRDILNSMF